MKLYVVRHGETIENANNCLVGRINSGLTANGLKQAKEVAKQLNGIDLIISSPLDRCKQTAEIISDNEIEIIYDDKLLGRDHGEFTGISRDKIDFDEYWNISKNVQYETAECVKILYDRIADLITELRENYNDKNIAIVTHSGVIRMIYYYFKGIPENGILSAIDISNCQVFEYNL